MNTTQQHQLLQKILAIIAEIQSQMNENGVSKTQVARFFGEKIFRIEGGSTLNRSEFDIRKQIGNYLSLKKKQGYALRSTLVELMAKLEIENGSIEEYEEYEPQNEPALVLSKRRSSNSSKSNSSKLASDKASSIWDRYGDSFSSPSEPKFYPRLNKLMSFEKELNESLIKTKMLKNIIQQRLMEDMEETYASRVRHIHELLALQS